MAQTVRQKQWTLLDSYIFSFSSIFRVFPSLVIQRSWLIVSVVRTLLEICSSQGGLRGLTFFGTDLRGCPFFISRGILIMLQMTYPRKVSRWPQVYGSCRFLLRATLSPFRTFFLLIPNPFFYPSFFFFLWFCFKKALTIFQVDEGFLSLIMLFQ